MNRLIFIRRVLYRLKRRYGEAMDIVERVSDIVDLQTGRKTIEKRTIRVNRVIILPAMITKEFKYDLTFIATNKNFTYGGLYDTTTRNFIFDRQDLGDWVITTDQYFLFKGVRYDCQKIEDLEDGTGYNVIAKQCLDAEVEQIKYATVNDTVEFVDSTAKVSTADVNDTIVFDDSAGGTT